MSYEFWEESAPLEERSVDPEFRLSEGAYLHLLGALAASDSIPGMQEFLERHKPDTYRTQDAFTHEEK